MEKLILKKKLIELCKNELNQKIAMYEKAMQEEQNTANQYKGIMESRHSTFKEEAQDRKNAFAMRIEMLMKQLSALISIKQDVIYNKPEFGAVVELENDSYFISFFIFEEPVTLEGKEFITLSKDSPLGFEFKNKRKGDIFNFNGKTFKITDIY